MSWIKKRGPNVPNQSAVPSVPMYNPNQHSSAQQPQQYWQQYGQTHQQDQQEPQQPQQPYQNYNHYQFQNSAPQQQYSYGNYGQPMPNLQQVQHQPQQSSEMDSWNSWNWGEENNSNIQAGYVQNNTNPVQEVASANIAKNFVNDETWNWSLEDSSSTSSLLKQEGTEKGSVVNENTYGAQSVQSNDHLREDLFPKVGSTAAKHNQNLKSGSLDSENQNSQIVPGSASVEHKSAIKKVNKPEMLPAQWSTESQISQDSSENIQTSDSNSRILSRSSTTSESSLPLQDLGNVNNEKVNSFETNLDRSRKISDATLTNEPPSRNLRNAEMLQHENVENVSHLKSYTTPPPSVKSQTATPPPPMKNPPPLMPSQSDDSQNPYKRTVGVSHRAINKYMIETQSQPQQSMAFPPQTTFPLSVNLETLPDNSEQPDSYPLQSTQLIRKVSATKTPLPNCPDNNEIAPINDRNQYLETGQLSNSEVMVDNNDVLPPPGLQRMVLGQMEFNEQNIRQEGRGDSQLEEPPPGLSRMVLGQNVNSDNSKNKLPKVNNEIGEPPVGFHRMIPGESSSPENSKWNKNTAKRSISRRENPFPEPERDIFLSENSQNQPTQTRSATIGADTPPVPPNPSLDSENNDVAPKDNNDTENVSNDSRKSSKVPKNTPENIRRASIDGQPEDEEIAVITSSVRDLTVGGNVVESGPSKGAAERPPRKSSVHETSDSDSKREEVSSKGRDHRDKNRDRDKNRRYKDNEEEYDRGKEKGKRYSPSPDRYRDKKYDRRKYRDRRYDEESDYYSDKEHRDKRRDQRDKYDDYKKYSSLKKEKYKEKQRRDPREGTGRDSKRSEYYYGRYEDDYEEAPRSRPSSRSDSMHESYRERTHGRDRHRERDRDRHRRPRDHRDPYMQMQGYPYDPYSPYYQQLQYQYYENLRRTNPQAYAELYRKYYQQTGTQQTYGEEERASVHSGRSSANDELAKDRYTRQSFYSQASYPHVGDYYREGHSISGHYGHSDIRMYDRTDSSLNLEETVTASQRLTPAKFTTSHIKASISSGIFVKILPHYPLDGQLATVEIGGFKDYLQYDDEFRELSEFPGPLVKGVTHKKTIIEYCETKIRNALTNDDVNDIDSYILMWELMILLLRQNGMVVGTDIAELLMKNRKIDTSRRPSIASNSSSVVMERTESLNNLNSEASSGAGLKEEVITNKFREYLLYGSGKEALEWAMKHGLWGHALFLASKLDKRTYASVMTRFANGLPMNDPLQTLYQLLSGKVPAAVTCVADEKWGDWRPHLAMILSNTTQRPDLDRKAITTLADTLFNRGNLYAAHFCYLMAQVGFGRYGSDSAKIVLLGSNQTRSFAQFATNEAIHLTEIYEYACSLNDSNFVMPEFQVYKYLIATRMSDRGLLEKSLAYLERVATTILQNPVEYQPSLVASVCHLADRLKYCEPVVVEDPDADVVDYTSTRADNTWLKNLKSVEDNYKVGLLSNQSVPYQAEHQVNQYVESQDVYQQQQQVHQQQSQQQYQYGVSFDSWQQQPIPEQPQAVHDIQHQQVETQDGYGTQQYGDQQQYWQSHQQQWPEAIVDQQPNSLNQFNQQHQDDHQQQVQTNLWSNAQSEPCEEVKNDRDKVSTSCSSSSTVSLVASSSSALRKRLTSPVSTGTVGSSAPIHINNKYSLLRDTKKQSAKSESNIETSESMCLPKKHQPFKIRSAEEFRFDSSSFEESSDGEAKFCRGSGEKSYLIRNKHETKILSTRNESKATKYSTFDLKVNERRGKMVKYKSLDEPINKNLVKYCEIDSKVVISAQDFDSTFRLTKFQRKPKQDIITCTVDSWAKRNKKGMFSNIKSSIFKHTSSPTEKTNSIFKPLVFGGTYPIDVPVPDESGDRNTPGTPASRESIESPQDGNLKISNISKNGNHKMVINELPVVREYGKAQTFDIDMPI
ncbi:uncharacterized protein LOC108741774 isoform X3 [Agrilus planipennis]|uniref:Uncharacterized protein LOC108741774 isoform X3 n=1 Tax=Agrilus planipennis TaxID=224129 RepID=A0A1W4XIE6_AGRPL|nr:uncharacterized protein LOC108741774 isoform X3 [Agrilus planipennis]